MPFVGNFSLLSDLFRDIFLRRLLDITRAVQKMLMRRLLSDSCRKFYIICPLRKRGWYRPCMYIPGKTFNIKPCYNYIRHHNNLFRTDIGIKNEKGKTRSVRFASGLVSRTSDVRRIETMTKPPFNINDATTDLPRPTPMLMLLEGWTQT